MSSGVAIEDAVVEKFTDLKLKKAYKFMICKITDDLKSITVEEAVPQGDYDNFMAKLPKNECRYGVFDFHYSTADGERNKILFYTWSPDTAKIKHKMIYASSKDVIRKKLDGVFTEVQATDLSELSYEAVLDKVTRISS